MFDDLNSRLGIPGSAVFSSGNGRLPKLTLTHAGGECCEIYLHGAHVAAWQSAAGDELLFLSRASHFAPDKPIRGGIPVIFPQFGGKGLLPQHGLARTADWSPESIRINESSCALTVKLQLTDTPATRTHWPHAFALKLGVTLAESALTVAFQVQNTGDTAFAYSAVLHTYFRLADIHRAALYGLRGVTLIDDLRGGLREVETREVIRFAEEIDRIYLAAPDMLRLVDEATPRTFTITKDDMPDVVVWNPWITKARRMSDFDDDEYRWMACVETGKHMAEAQELPAGAEWRGETTFTVS